MALLAIEHGRAAYWADFVFYAAAVATLATVLTLFGPREQWPCLASLVIGGTVAWTLVEYAVHRFVLHGLEPFRAWHTKHHERPTALISAPTLLSATLIGLLVFLPGFLAAGAWRSAALTLGLTAGYLGYALLHHATHHWRPRSAWLKRRKRWHALHHHAVGAGCYGVSCACWDRVFGSAKLSRTP